MQICETCWSLINLNTSYINLYLFPSKAVQLVNFSKVLIFSVPMPLLTRDICLVANLHQSALRTAVWVIYVEKGQTASLAAFTERKEQGQGFYAVVFSLRFVLTNIHRRRRASTAQRRRQCENICVIFKFYARLCPQHDNKSRRRYVAF